MQIYFTLHYEMALPQQFPYSRYQLKNAEESKNKDSVPWIWLIYYRKYHKEEERVLFPMRKGSFTNSIPWERALYKDLDKLPAHYR